MSDNESTVPASTFPFVGLSMPTRAEMEAIPLGSSVILISWPDAPPTIAGVVWDKDTSESYLNLVQHWEPDATASDVFMFYLNKAHEEDDIIRRVMNLADEVDINSLNEGPSEYSLSDVRDMIRASLALHSSPF